MAVQPGLCRTWSETPKTGFLTTRLKYIKLIMYWASCAQSLRCACAHLIEAMTRNRHNQNRSWAFLMRIANTQIRPLWKTHIVGYLMMKLTLTKTFIWWLLYLSENSYFCICKCRKRHKIRSAASHADP